MAHQAFICELCHLNRHQLILALLLLPPLHQDVPILVANSNDSTAVGKVLSQTRVVIAVAGPFSRYGNTVGG